MLFEVNELVKVGAMAKLVSLQRHGRDPCRWASPPRENGWASTLQSLLWGKTQFL